MAEKFIEYYTHKKRICKEKSNSDDVVRMPFSDLEKYKDTIEWHYISNYVTEETCTKDFYDTFDSKLLWNSGCNFISYVAEKDLYDFNRINKIPYSTLFRLKPDLSEDFCRKYLESKDDPTYGGRYLGNYYSAILKNVEILSTDFIEETLEKICLMELYYKANLIKDLVMNQKVTEDQFVRYFEDNNKLKKHLTKFCRFIALSNPKNDYSVEFIKEHRVDLNQKAFFNTEQACDHLCYHEISDNALKVFKTKINYVSFINSGNEKNLEKAAKICKKEIFDTLIKESDKISNEENLDLLKKLM